MLDSPEHSCHEVRYPAGRAVCPSVEHTVVSLHCGPPTRVTMREGGTTRAGMQARGHLSVMPPGCEVAWESGETVQLLLTMSPGFLEWIAHESGARSVAPTLGFQMRDPRLERLAWALRDDPGDEPLYRDSLFTAFAACLLGGAPTPTGGLPPVALARILAYVDECLGGEVSLAQMARVAGFGVSHFATLFRRSMGVSPHQYVLRERVERAERLLARGEMVIGEVALAVGFADQSHLTRHMRRLTGRTPKEFLPPNRPFLPNAVRTDKTPPHDGQ